MGATRKRLSDLSVGAKCRVVKINATTDIKRRLADLGIFSGSDVFCIGKSPLGDPRAYVARGGMLAIRRRDAECIEIESEESFERE